MAGANAPKTSLDYTRLSDEAMEENSKAVLAQYQSRRTVRNFSPEPIPMAVVERCILAAGTAPSGAHKQPWHFCLVTDPEIKKQIREAAEKEEYLNYHGRMSDRWVADLKPLDTNHIKPHLDEAPALIVVFRQAWQPDEVLGKKQNYYVQESVGIACGMLLAALHACGLVALTHTPSPMGFLSEILDRPAHEKAFLLIPIGFPADDCQVPDIKRKTLAEIQTTYASGTK
jgi:nitroreductase